jgi:uncharacterized phage-associated protein
MFKLPKPFQITGKDSVMTARLKLWPVLFLAVPCAIIWTIWSFVIYWRLLFNECIEIWRHEPSNVSDNRAGEARSGSSPC